MTERKYDGHHKEAIREAIENSANVGLSGLNDGLCVGVYSYVGRHTQGDISETVLATGTQDAMEFLCNKYSNLRIFGGGSTHASATQCTPAARKAILGT